MGHIFALCGGVSGPQEGEQRQSRCAGRAIQNTGVIGTVLETPASIGSLMPGQPGQPQLDGPFALSGTSARLDELRARLGSSTFQDSRKIRPLFLSGARLALRRARDFASALAEDGGRRFGVLVRIG